MLKNEITCCCEALPAVFTCDVDHALTQSLGASLPYKLYSLSSLFLFIEKESNPKKNKSLYADEAVICYVICMLSVLQF